MKEILDFIFLSIFLGPVGSIPYALEYFSPLEIFIIITLLYTIPIPLIFKLFEYGGHHKRLYRTRIFMKASSITGKRIDELVDRGDKITELFEKKMGHLGLYATIVVFTIAFGIFWATLFSYILMVKRKRAIYSMILGVIIGNICWILAISYFKNYITLEIILLVLLIPLWVYGTKREIDILRNVVKKLKLMREKRKTTKH